MRTEWGESVAEPLGGGRDGPRVYIVHNAALEDLLFDRNLTGVGFRRACLRCSRYFVGHLADECPPEDTAELMILSKGLVYQLGEAMAAETGRTLPTNMIATSRADVSPDTARIDVPYTCFDAPADVLIIGDTVASGATIVAALGRCLDAHPLRRVYVVSYAGTLLGAARIAKFCVRHEVEPTFLFGLAAFGLGDNGFDLAFLHPDTITRSRCTSARPTSTPCGDPAPTAPPSREAGVERAIGGKWGWILDSFKKVSQPWLRGIDHGLPADAARGRAAGHPATGGGAGGGSRASAR
ncbi:hypothetical protein AGRA3207_004503 [Actinomadura graeca]|uniref:Phosphoribosyltransferase n=1 Tax=Actinomadura graeca TaxID=2750812 RepID=A0ABX8QX70_9ACTN|nr:hypothetical protein [Actinomadura graeca]QXJ23360.1 hypothetical protein AGRA3207_004503 [Actinomadura graeca]